MSQCTNNKIVPILSKNLQYVRYLSKSGGPSKMALHMHISWLQALGASPKYTCEQLVNVKCNGQNLMCENGGCTMSSVKKGGAPCAFDCTQEDCEACMKRSDSGKCTGDICVPNRNVSMLNSDTDTVADPEIGDPGNWSDEQKAKFTEMLMMTFPIAHTRVKLYDVPKDKVIACAVTILSNKYKYPDENETSSSPSPSDIFDIMNGCVQKFRKGLSTGSIIGISIGVLLLILLIGIFINNRIKGKNKGGLKFVDDIFA